MPLTLVPTPIGNLEDITLRALRVLRESDIIACEDTRTSGILLRHYDITGKKLVSFHVHNENERVNFLLERLREGLNVSVISDAGTPGISDPGAVLAGLARKAGHTVIPIPGPSAFATLVSVAGAGGKTLIFEGFLSPKPGRRRSRLRELLATGDAVVLYESPFRITKLLNDIADIDSERRVVVGRELTKLHEEITEGTAKEVLEDYASRSKILGEFAVFISGNKNTKLSDESSDN